jgi:uncharacterized protein (TIGR03000 family)
MIRTTLSHGVPPLVAAVAILVGAGPAAAQHGGHGGSAFHGGGYHGGSGGYHYGYHPYYGSHAYRPHYGGYYGYPYWGYWGLPYVYGDGSYPSYDYGYYSHPYAYSSGYSAPPSTTAVNDSVALKLPPAEPGTEAGVTPAASAEPANGTSVDPAFAPPSTTALITVLLPDNADLWFDRTKMTGTGTSRVFVTPQLTPGQKYTYTLRARWADNGGTKEQARTLVFAPGANLDVSFPAPPGAGEKAKDAVTRK